MSLCLYQLNFFMSSPQSPSLPHPLCDYKFWLNHIQGLCLHTCHLELCHSLSIMYCDNIFCLCNFFPFCLVFLILQSLCWSCKFPFVSMSYVQVLYQFFVFLFFSFLEMALLELSSILDELFWSHASNLPSWYSFYHQIKRIFFLL